MVTQLNTTLNGQEDFLMKMETFYSLRNALHSIVFILAYFIASSSLSASTLGEDDLYCIYADADYAGEAYCGTSNVASLDDVPGVLNNLDRDVSSLIVRDGYQLIVYSGRVYRGATASFTGSHGFLGSTWDNEIRAIKIRAVVDPLPEVCLYKQRDYQTDNGYFCTAGDEIVDLRHWDNRLTSAQVPPDFEVTLYQSEDFQGASYTFTQSEAKFSQLNNEASSVIIRYLGPPDADEDGVIDADDNCPDTPSDESVDQNGCSLTQLDGDGDGVSDAVDLCPTTPAGLQVNKLGCALSELDTDGDGVHDDIDQCSATEPGQIVDQNGCAPNQLDSDGDGVTDDLDRCPNSDPNNPDIDEQGCAPGELDTDGDGAPDDVDGYPLQGGTQCLA